MEVNLTQDVLNLELLEQGEDAGDHKVRRIFTIGGRTYFVTGDNVSASDMVFDEIEGKGMLLDSCSNAWKKILKPVIRTDLVTDNEKSILRVFRCKKMDPALKGRITVVEKGLPCPTENIVRFSIEEGGSLWKAYSEAKCRSGVYLGNYLPAGLKKGQELPMPIFTPSTKEGFGKHDQNIIYSEMVSIYNNWIEENSIDSWTGENLSQAIKSASLSIAMIGKFLLLKHGQELKDTKLEFVIVPKRDNHCFLIGHEIRLADEVFTGDSSKIVMQGVHYDKQYLRDHLKDAGWDKKSRFKLPEEVKKTFIERYRVNAEIAQRILNSF